MRRMIKDDLGFKSYVKRVAPTYKIFIWNIRTLTVRKMLITSKADNNGGVYGKSNYPQAVVKHVRLSSKSPKVHPKKYCQ